MKKIMLIAGCSHAAGYEIDGSMDSVYNRGHSFGNLLAVKMGYAAVNIATGGATNTTIARDVIEWFSTEYDVATMEVFVLISWTESARIEVPFYRPTWYAEPNESASWVSKSGVDYLRVNHSWPGGNSDETESIKTAQTFMIKNLQYQEIVSANCVLQLQYFLKMNQVKYLMSNSMHMFTKDKHLSFYLNLIDASCYMQFDDSDNAFYWKYRNTGYINEKAKYWHHSEQPHAMYAEELFQFLGSH